MSFGMAYATRKHNKKMAKGGDVKGVHKQSDVRREGTSEAGHFAKYQTSGDDGSKAYTNAKAKEEHHKVLGEMKSMPKPNLMAEGGEVDDADMQDADMIARIMHKRKEYAHGGEVANDVGVAEADELPAEFDDLVLRDDDMGDADYTAKNSGDEEGDVINKIMSKRKK